MYSPCLSLPSFVYITRRPSLSPTKYGRLIYREEKHDRSPPSASLCLFPTLPLPPLPLTPNLTEHIVHQLQTVLHNYFLQCINIKPSPGSALQLAFLTLTPNDFAYSGFFFLWSPRCCLLWSCLFPKRQPLCLSHAPSAPGGVTWRASDYKKQR